jgi:NAD-dependent SIR2 family protein deacetylase
MKKKRTNQPVGKPAAAPGVKPPDIKHDAGYFLYLKCLYCGTVFDTAPCAEDRHGKFSRGICPNCAACGPFVPLTPADESGT